MALVSIFAVTTPRPAHAFNYGAGSLINLGIGLTGLVLAGGIATGIGNTHSVLTGTHRAGWVGPGFFHGF